jgi:hypothetical protein
MRESCLEIMELNIRSLGAKMTYFQYHNLKLAPNSSSTTSLWTSEAEIQITQHLLGALIDLAFSGSMFLISVVLCRTHMATDSKTGSTSRDKLFNAHIDAPSLLHLV